MKSAERVETRRLILRRPRAQDAEAIFRRYAADPVVTKYLAWPRHESVEDTRKFLAFSEAEWGTWPAGPYLIESRCEGKLLGSTGLAFESTTVASTGYILAQDSWGLGYATEALTAITEVARGLRLERLYALCHPEHARSARVLEKCGFQREDRLRDFFEFPNLRPGVLQDCLRYRWIGPGRV
jgi:RimJ/RimL family protein N-acetyltransferase